MGNHKISLTLSEKDIKKAIDYIDRYSEWLKNKTDLLVKKLADIGIDVIDENYSKSIGDADKTHSTYAKFQKYGNDVRCVIVCEGKELLFIEFGSGVTYNQTRSHPKEDEFGYGIGTYPDQKYAFDPNGWWYKDDYDIKHHSYGQQMTMPMYNAYRTIVEDVKSVAKEVFR